VDPFTKKVLIAFCCGALLVCMMGAILISFIVKHQSELFSKPYSKDAIHRFDRRVAACPTDATAWHDRGRWYWNHGKIKDALADFNNAITLAPKHADWYRDRASVHWSLGELEASASDYTKSIELEPTYTPALSSRATVFERLGRVDEAGKDFEQAIKEAPSLYRYNQRGSFLCRHKKYDEALANDTEAIAFKTDKKTVDWARQIALKRRARIYVKLQHPELALADLTKVISLSKSSYEDAYLSRARVHERMGERQEALADCSAATERLSKILDKSTKAHRGTWDYTTRAWLYRILGETQKSDADLRKVVELTTEQIKTNADATTSYEWRAVANQSLNNSALAATDRKKAREIHAVFNKKNGEGSYSHYVSGLSLAEDTKYTEAVKQYSHAISLQSDNALYYAHRAGSLLACGQKEKALKDAEKAVELSPSGLSYSRLAQVYAAVGRYQDAIAAAEDALVLDDDCVIAYEAQADAFTALHMPAKAATALSVSKLCTPQSLKTCYEQDEDEDD
jgi:tetratricopeptide (TPR) repeat protein